MEKVMGKVVLGGFVIAALTSCTKDFVVDSTLALAQRMKTFGQGPSVPFPSTKLFVTASAQGKSSEYERGVIYSELLATPSATTVRAGTKTNDIAYPDGLALDLVFNQMFWTDRWTGNLVRSDLGGSKFDVLESGLKAPSGIALDLTNNLMCWAERGTTTNDGTIRCADYRDGSNVQTLFSGRAVPEAIALALAQRTRTTSGNTTADSYDIYWTESGAKTVVKGQIQVKTVSTTTGTGSNQNTSVTVAVTGTNATTLYTDPSFPTRDVALDLAAKRLYWTTRNGIYTADLDGTNAKLLLNGLVPNHLALDLTNQYLYYTANQNDDVGVEDPSRIDGYVHRAKLDGTQDAIFDAKGAGKLALALGN